MAHVRIVQLVAAKTILGRGSNFKLSTSSHLKCVSLDNNGW